MLYIKNVLLQIQKKAVRCATLMLFLIVAIIPIMIGTYLGAVVEGYFDYIAEQTGNCIFVGKYGDADVPIPEDMIAELMAVKGVIGYDQSNECLCLPISFRNTGYENHTAYSAEPSCEEVVLVGDHDISLHHSFRTGTFELMEGEYPTEQNAGVLIDQYLALSNGISLNDTISFWNEEINAEVSAKVCGIYIAHQPPKVDHDAYYAISAASYIFCDREITYRKTASFYDKNAPIMVYIDNYKNMDSTITSFEAICTGYSDEHLQFRCIDEKNNAINLESGSGGLLGFQKIMKLFVTAVKAIILVLIFLMLLLWMQDHYQEIGIYLVLGWNRVRIISTLLCEGVIILAVAGCLGIFIGSFVLNQYGENVFLYFSNILNGHASNLTLLQEMIGVEKHSNTIMNELLADAGLYLSVITLNGVRVVRHRCSTLLNGKRDA